MEEGTVFVVGFLVEISGKGRPRSYYEHVEIESRKSKKTYYYYANLMMH